MSFTLSPNMSLRIPVVGDDQGPDYAINLNFDLQSILDTHDHTPGKGVPITPAGIDISSDLDFNDHFALDVAGVTLTAQLTTPNPGTVYMSGVDLYYTDGLGNDIRLTQLGSIAGTPGSIGGLVPPASANYVGGSQSFIFESNTDTAANLDVGSVIIRELIPNANGVTLSSPAALVSNYTVTLLPVLPAAEAFMTIDAGGQLAANIPAALGITASNIANSTITLAKLADALIQILQPSGNILSYGGSAAPTGYLLCDGTSYLRTDYPTLFTAIGTNFGAVDGTHFNVPDLRGRFLRGVDGTAGRDPDSASRTAMNTGGNTGNNVGSIQTAAFEAHRHQTFADVSVGAGALTSSAQSPAKVLSGGSAADYTMATDGSTDSTIGRTSNVGGSETRPINAYVNYIIKT